MILKGLSTSLYGCSIQFHPLHLWFYTRRCQGKSYKDRWRPSPAHRSSPTDLLPALEQSSAMCHHVSGWKIENLPCFEKKQLGFDESGRRTSECPTTRTTLLILWFKARTELEIPEWSFSLEQSLHKHTSQDPFRAHSILMGKAEVSTSSKELDLLQAKVVPMASGNWLSSF